MVDQTRQLRSFCFCGNTEDLCRLQWQLKNTQNVDHLQDRASGDMTSEAAARSQRMRLGWGTSCMEELWGKVQKLLEVRSVLQQEALHKPNQGQWWTQTNFTAFGDSVKPLNRKGRKTPALGDNRPLQEFLSILLTQRQQLEHQARAASLLK